jgi:hypothetical protein
VKVDLTCPHLLDGLLFFQLENLSSSPVQFLGSTSTQWQRSLSIRMGEIEFPVTAHRHSTNKTLDFTISLH